MWTVGACGMCDESCVWSCGDESAKDHVILLPRIFYENFEERSAAPMTPFQREHPRVAFFGCALENISGRGDTIGSRSAPALFS